MQERHTNRKLYFDEQAYTTETYVIPFVEQHYTIHSGTRVLEIGCGEGGNMKPFLDRGCTCLGVDLNAAGIANAERFYADHPHRDRLELIHANIFDLKRSDLTFDVIILRDVIEHIFGQELFMHMVKEYLSPNGVFFIGMPPWQMPFGGHQQVCQGKMAKLPFIHLLPRTLYRWLLHKTGQSPAAIKELLEIKHTGITIERFDRIARTESYQVLEKVMYLINPNYQIKFNLRPRRVVSVFKYLPYVRNFYTTAVYYLLRT